MTKTLTPDLNTDTETLSRVNRVRTGIRISFSFNSRVKKDFPRSREWNYTWSFQVPWCL